MLLRTLAGAALRCSAQTPHLGPQVFRGAQAITNPSFRAAATAAFSTTPAPRKTIPSELSPAAQEIYKARNERRDEMYRELRAAPTTERVSLEYLIEKARRSWALSEIPNKLPPTRDEAREWITKHKWMNSLFDVIYEGDSRWSCSRARVDAANLRVVRWWAQLEINLDAPVDMSGVLEMMPPTPQATPSIQRRRVRLEELNLERLRLQKLIAENRDAEMQAKRDLESPKAECDRLRLERLGIREQIRKIRDEEGLLTGKGKAFEKARQRGQADRLAKEAEERAGSAAGGTLPPS